MIINKKILLYSLLAGLAFGASRSWPMEAEETNPAGGIAKADADLTELLQQHPKVKERIQRHFGQYYIYNFTTKNNRERLARLQKDLLLQQANREKQLETLRLEQTALALLVKTECTGEPEEDKFQCALQ